MEYTSLWKGYIKILRPVNQNEEQTHNLPFKYFKLLRKWNLRQLLLSWHGHRAIFVSSSPFNNFGSWVLMFEVRREREPHSTRTDLKIMNSLRTWPQFVSTNTCRKPCEMLWCKFLFFFFLLMDIYFVRRALQWSYKYRNEILITCLNSSTTCVRSHAT